MWFPASRPRNPPHRAPGEGLLRDYRAAIDSTGAINDRLLYRVDGSYNASDGLCQFGAFELWNTDRRVDLPASDTLRFTLSEDLASRKAFDLSGIAAGQRLDTAITARCELRECGFTHPRSRINESPRP